MRLRATLADPAARTEAARRFARNQSADSAHHAPLQTAAERALETFAQGGLPAVAEFLQTNLAATDQPRAADVVIRMLSDNIHTLRALERERALLPALPTEGPEAQSAALWSHMALAALSDLTLYPSGVFLTLADFSQVQASVFQVSRSPGKNLVYLGALLLTLGIFSMFYIHDRRIWMWIRPQSPGPGSRILAAMTSQKRNLDFHQEFARLQQALCAKDRG
jgi:cytochrome c biogenesis protein